MKLKAKEYRKIAREKLSGHWGMSVLTAFVASLLGGFSYSSSSASLTTDIDIDELMETVDWESMGISFEQVTSYVNVTPAMLAVMGVITVILSIWGIAMLILGGPTRAGYCQYNLNLQKGEAEFDDLFSHYNIFLKAFLTNVLQSLFVFLWCLLFIVPGVIMSYAYSMTFYILAENPQLDPVEAIKHSRKMMKGHKWQLFCLQLSFIGWMFLSAFTLGIGAFFLAPYMEASTAAFYKNISGEYFANLETKEEIKIEE